MRLNQCCYINMAPCCAVLCSAALAELLHHHLCPQYSNKSPNFSEVTLQWVAAVYQGMNKPTIVCSTAHYSPLWRLERRSRRLAYKLAPYGSWFISESDVLTPLGLCRGHIRHPVKNRPPAWKKRWTQVEQDLIIQWKICVLSLFFFIDQHATKKLE